MVVSFCGLRIGPRHHRSPEKDLENEKCGLTKFLKPRSSWAAMKARKRPVHPPVENNSKVLTLKEWIESSPGVNASECEMGAHKQSSRKIHPSFHGELKEELLVESVSRGKEAGNSSVGRTTSTKGKKVSFRSPEVADVFVLDFYSPEMQIVCVAQ